MGVGGGRSEETPLLGWEPHLSLPHGGHFCSPAALTIGVTKCWCVQGAAGTRAGLGDEPWISFLCPNVQGSRFDPEPARGFSGKSLLCEGKEGAPWESWNSSGRPGGLGGF